MVGAGFGLSVAFAGIIQEIVDDGAARQPDGALDEADILLIAVIDIVHKKDLKQWGGDWGCQ